MSWLFCCGDEKEKAVEQRSTLDLSRPLMPELKEAIKFDDVEGLSGKLNEQSLLLNDILTQKKPNGV